MDGDRVEEKNLHRQELYAPVDVGRSKVGVAAAWARNAATHVSVDAEDAFLDHRNADTIIAMHDIVADCTDDAHARRLIDATCADYDVTLVSGAVHAHEGQVIVLHAPGGGERPDLSGIFGGRLNAEQDGCDMRDVPMAVIEAVAQRMTARIRDVLEQRAVINGRLEQYRGDNMTWLSIDPPQRNG